ncbi:MAG: hypothetical protein WEF50_17195 [Myxococcota bacterium]
MRRGSLALVTSFLMGSGLLACAKLSEFTTAHTYGPNFDYIPDEKVDSVMWQLARDVKRIDELTKDPASITQAQNEEIARLLVIMEDATGRLGKEGVRTNHPLIDEHREQFRADLEAARRGAMAKPPSYRLAEDVSTACMRCHEHGTR